MTVLAFKFLKQRKNYHKKLFKALLALILVGFGIILNLQFPKTDITNSAFYDF
jgi:hypothetical protein